MVDPRVFDDAGSIEQIVGGVVAADTGCIQMRAEKATTTYEGRTPSWNNRRKP